MSPTNMLTIGDALMQGVQLAAARDELGYAKVRNRLAMMKAENEQKELQAGSDYWSQYNALNQQQDGAAPQQNMLAPGTGMQQQQPPTMPPSMPATQPPQRPAAAATMGTSQGTGGGVGIPPEKLSLHGRVRGPIGYQSPDLESDARNTVQAMKTVESGGSGGSKPGASGESGVLQYMPDTWKKYSSEYNLSVLGRQGALPDTPENQEAVAEFKVRGWLQQGYSPQQIASMWNAGEGRPDWVGHKGVNNKGVQYDTEAHVGKFDDALGKLASSPTGVQSPTNTVADASGGIVPTQGASADESTQHPQFQLPGPDPSKSPQYNKFVVEQALAGFGGGIAAAIGSKNQKTLNAYLDNTDRIAPFLKPVTSFYRGLTFTGGNKMKVTIPKGMMTPQLVAQYADKIPPEYLPILKGAMGPNGYAVDVELDNDRVTELKAAKDVTAASSTTPKTEFAALEQQVRARLAKEGITDEETINKEVLKESQERKFALQRGDVKPYREWSNAEKEQAFQLNFLDPAIKPSFAWRDTDRKEYSEEFLKWMNDHGITAGDTVMVRGAVKAGQMQLKKNAERQVIVEGQVDTIDKNIQELHALRTKYGQNFSKLLNTGVNMYKRGVVGSGDLGALQYVLKSIANESAKLESGSLGIAEVSQSQAEAMAKIFDPNLNTNDIFKITDTVLKLGQIRKDALTRTQSTMEKNLSNAGNWKKLVGIKESAVEELDRQWQREYREKLYGGGEAGRGASGVSVQQPEESTGRFKILSAEE